LFRGIDLSGARLWDENAYQSFRKTIEAFPPGDLRDQTLERIGRLDCVSPDEALASCDPPSSWIPPLTLPPEAAAWRNALEVARVEDPAYQQALATVLKELVCSGDDDAIYALRGQLPGTSGSQRVSDRPHPRLAAAGPEAPALVDFIMSPACPVSGSLTDDDNARLVHVKKEATKKPGG
jgi:hypothetical protein